MTTHEDRHTMFVSGYIEDEFQMMLDSAIQGKFPDMEINGEVEASNWEIKTTSTYVYGPNGWFEDIHKEKIAHISVTVNFRVRGALQGTPQRIHFTPSQQFYNLAECVKEVIASSERTRQGLEAGNEYNLDNIGNRRFTVAKIDMNDYRVVHLVQSLIQVGKSQQKATEIALAVVNEYPTTHKLDLLLELALDHGKQEEEAKDE